MADKMRGIYERALISLLSLGKRPPSVGKRPWQSPGARRLLPMAMLLGPQAHVRPRLAVVLTSKRRGNKSTHYGVLTAHMWELF